LVELVPGSGRLYPGRFHVHPRRALRRPLRLASTTRANLLGSLVPRSSVASPGLPAASLGLSMLGGQVDGIFDRVAYIYQFTEPDRKPALRVRPPSSVLASVPHPDTDVRPAFVQAPVNPNLLIGRSPRGADPLAFLLRRARGAALDSLSQGEGRPWARA